MSKRRNFSPWAYWRLTHERSERPDSCPFDDLHSFAEWRERAVARVDGLLGRRPERVPADVEREQVGTGDGFTIERWVFDSEALMSVPALLLVPDGRIEPGPAVLAVHGHGLDKDLLCGIDEGDPERRAAIAGDNGDFAAQIARAGYVVLAPDLRTFGERADNMLEFPESDDFAIDVARGEFDCDWNFVCAAAAGVQPMTQNVWDLARCLDVLGTHPLVDAARLGVAGWSYGATLTLLLAATDERVKAAVVSCFFSSWAAAHRVPWNLCGAQVLFGMLGEIEHADLAALVAPRALLVESATEDVLFPAEVATSELAKVRQVYEHLRAPGALVHDVFEGEHRWHGTEVAAFLGAQL